MKKMRYILYILILVLGGFGRVPVFAETVSETEETIQEESGDEVLEEAGGTQEEEGEEEFEETDGNETEEEEESFALGKELIILAISAGGKNNKGELIELMRLSEESLLLSGLSIRYRNSSGSVDKTIFTFSENLEMVGEKILFRLKNSEDATSSDFVYSQDLAQKGGRVSLEISGEEIDAVCWGDYPGCKENEKFSSSPQTTLLRDILTMKFAHTENYEPEWQEGREVLMTLEDEDGSDENDEEDKEKEGEDEEETGLDGDKEKLEEEEEVLPVCQGLEFSELYSYFVSDRAEQFIEFYNANEEKVKLEGCSLVYKNKSYPLSGEVEAGGYFVIFPEKIELNLTKNPTKSNLLEIVDVDGSVVDSLEYFNGQKKGVALARFLDLESGKEGWEFTKILTPGAENKRVEEVIEEKSEDEIPEPVCRGVQFSEILAYYETDKSEQFIELYNPTARKISLDGCSLKYKNKLYGLFGAIAPEGFFLYFPSEFTLTKNPVNSNKLEIIDADGSVVDALEYFNGQKKGVAVAQFGISSDGKEIWEQTYSPTPGEENNYQKYKTCPEGKVINEATGNCVKTVSLATTLKECPAGSYRNPLTNRCKKYATTASTKLKECAEGYERNPTTNRCRKIMKNDGAKYSVAEETFEEKSSFVAIWAIVAVGGVGIIYIIFEYRSEILGLFKRRRA